MIDEHKLFAANHLECIEADSYTATILLDKRGTECNILAYCRDEWFDRLTWKRFQFEASTILDFVDLEHVGLYIILIEIIFLTVSAFSANISEHYY